MNVEENLKKKGDVSKSVVVGSILIVLITFAALFFSSTNSNSNYSVEKTPSNKLQGQVLPKTDNLPDWQKRLNWAQAYSDCTNRELADYRALGLEVYFVSDLSKEQADSVRLTCNYEADYISGIDDEP